MQAYATEDVLHLLIKVSMDAAVLKILLLTGFGVHSSSNPYVFYLIQENKTWDEAQLHCDSHYITIAQIQNTEEASVIENITTGGYTSKAWIGLYSYGSEWTLVDQNPATYFHWRNSQREEFCAATGDDGFWSTASCSDLKAYVCHDGGAEYYVIQNQKTWNDAKTACEARGDTLVSIGNESINSDVKSLTLPVDGAWIGLSKRKLWYWWSPGENNYFTNWESGQPDNLNGMDSCAAVMLTNGRWTEEHCDTKYPFFCIGVYQGRKTVVRMKFASSTNMEDPAYSANLLQQLSAALAKQGVTDFKLTWKKPPVKTQVSSESSTRCLMNL
ncbi:macrophage mannose receptor 1-like isoform X2 [Anoplopoma fimbria]|uniref:macrophage mannose receptor 1-like isoform X2 n=1 Tax=Anoplopoma fimbria TaxID=229290 RepID=UPI0023ED0EB6|nr:macrophage mannose receptor 1-like isoform X2 [Anoplopoma fimbria]